MTAALKKEACTKTSAAVCLLAEKYESRRKITSKAMSNKTHTDERLSSHLQKFINIK
jgi:hypothetical protein